MYIGCHKTFNLDDGYIGSGTILKRAIKKYGIENFQKEILFVFDTAEEMFRKEAEIVDKLFIESDETYNLLIGGCGGFEHINSTGKNMYGKNGENGKKNLWKGEKIVEYLKEKGLWEDYRIKMSNSVKRKWEICGHPWTGRKHKESTKKKIGEKLSIAQKGEKNSQYGTRWAWISKNGEVKRVPLASAENYLSDGWIRGIKKLIL